MNANAESKDKLLKTLNSHLLQHGNNHIVSRYLLEICILLNAKGYSLIMELEKDGYIEYHPQTNKNVMITPLGIRAAEIGYQIIKNEVKEKKQKKVIVDIEKEQLEMKKLRFDAKWAIWISVGAFIILIISFVISLKK